MLPGRNYLMKIGSATVDRDDRAAQVQDQREHARAARRQELELNEIGVCNIELDRADRRSTPTTRTATRAASS